MNSIVQYCEASQRIRDHIPKVQQVKEDTIIPHKMSKAQFEELCWRRKGGVFDINEMHVRDSKRRLAE